MGNNSIRKPNQTPLLIAGVLVFAFLFLPVSARAAVSDFTLWPDPVVADDQLLYSIYDADWIENDNLRMYISNDCTGDIFLNCEVDSRGDCPSYGVFPLFYPAAGTYDVSAYNFTQGTACYYESGFEFVGAPAVPCEAGLDKDCIVYLLGEYTGDLADLLVGILPAALAFAAAILILMFLIRVIRNFINDFKRRL